MVEYGCKIEEKVQAMKNEIKEELKVMKSEIKKKYTNNQK